jgi:hypothetical protein
MPDSDQEASLTEYPQRQGERDGEPDPGPARGDPSGQRGEAVEHQRPAQVLDEDRHGLRGPRVAEDDVAELVSGRNSGVLRIL